MGRDRPRRVDAALLAQDTTMLLSLKHRFLFVHIPKTGGTSVRAALAPLRWQDPWYLASFLCSRLSHLSSHRLGSKLPRHAAAICAQEMLPRELFEGLFKFAVVRNPFDLQVSSYHHLKRERPQLLADCPDFASFVRCKLDPERPPQYHFDVSVRPQREYLIDLNGNLIVDFVARYERLDEDFATICERLGLRTQRPLPRRRQATDRTGYRSYYDAATRDLVARAFAVDLERLEYRF